MMNKIEHPERGKTTVAGWPLRMSDSYVPIHSSPLLGADNEAVLGDWLGCSADEVADLRKRSVI